MDKKTDILVIGAGPAGLSAAINAIARGKTVRVSPASIPYSPGRNGSTIISVCTISPVPR